MKTVRLGKTGLEVSRIGMGGIPITRPTEDEAIKVIRRALDLGITFIDTAWRYGDSEERIGKGVAGRRDQVVIATKTFTRGKGGEAKATALQQLEASLESLNTDYIDLWQFHGVNTLEEYKLNFVNNDPADELVPLAREHDVGFIAMKPLAGGQLGDANLAIKYLLQFDNVVPDPGIQKVEEIVEIVHIVNSGPWELTPQEWQEIEDIRARLGRRFCQWCRYCMPCPQGVDIPPLMNARCIDNYGESFISWVAEAVESAKSCIQCGECEEKCPYNLPIREMIEENIAFYECVAAEHYAEGANKKT